MTIPIGQLEESASRRFFTVADIFKMIEAGIISEDENFELIDGEIITMSPKGNQHEVIKSALNRLLARHASDDLRLGVETSVYLAESTFLEPDLCLYPIALLPEDVKGSDILLAIEVGATSLRYDRGLKASVYARHSVRELWVIDAKRRVTWIHTQPQPDGSWGLLEQKGSTAGLTTESLPGVSIVLATLV